MKLNETDLSIIDVLKLRGTGSEADAIAHRFVSSNAEDVALSYRELWHTSCALANLISDNSIDGDRVLLLYPPGLDFVVAFFACLISGRVAVPTAIPLNSKAAARTHALLHDSDAALALTTQNNRERIESTISSVTPSRRFEIISTDGFTDRQDSTSTTNTPTASDVALLQYTSGSTNDPKGVVVTHGNIVANLNCIYDGFDFSQPSHMVNLMPAFHDMGLIGGILEPLYAGCECTLISPLEFMRRPSIWLQTISRFQATISGGPNFAFDACVSRIQRRQMAGINLSSWRVAYCGAEPIRVTTLANFSEKFSKYGFQESALLPCYGLAEATLFVCCKPHDQTYATKQMPSSTKLASFRDNLTPRTIVSVGKPHETMDVRVVDPDSGEEVPDGELGEIWISGESVCQGYWNRESTSSEAFAATLRGQINKQYLRSGDIGFAERGEIFISGRTKNIIIIRGANLACEYVESLASGANRDTAQSLAAAFSVQADRTEKLVVIQEIPRNTSRELTTPLIVAAIQDAIVKGTGVRADDILLVHPSTLPRTTSGKVRRDDCRRLYIAEDLTIRR